MSRKIAEKLKILNDDYSVHAGKPANNFYCPILQTDLETELCLAHIVNDSFPGAPRAWTVQRKDVDNFYGAYFGSAFVILQHAGNSSLDKVIIDKDLSKKLRPEFVVEGRTVEHFYSDSEIPSNYSSVTYQAEGGSTKLGLKIAPEELNSTNEDNISIQINVDVRLAALVSLIKSAHLTMFELLGYRYAMSSSGHYIGKGILGEFYLQTRSKEKNEIITEAKTFFREHSTMVRPLANNDIDLAGTIVDRKFYICRGGGGSIWGYIIIVNTGNMLHAVLMPNFDDPENAVRYLNFIKNENEKLEVHICQYNDGKVKAAKQSIELTWPKLGDFHLD